MKSPYFTFGILVLSAFLSGCFKPASSEVKQAQQALLTDAVQLLSAQVSEDGIQIFIQRDESNVVQPQQNGLSPIDFSEKLSFTRDAFGNLTYSPTASIYGLSSYQLACNNPACSDLNVVLQRESREGRDSAGYRLVVVNTVSCTLTATDGIGGKPQKMNVSFPTATFAQNLDRKTVAMYGKASAYNATRGRVIANYLRNTLGTAMKLRLNAVETATRADGSTVDTEAANKEYVVKAASWDEDKKTFEILATDPEFPKGATTLKCTYP